MKKLFFLLAFLPVAAFGQTYSEIADRQLETEFTIMGFVQKHPFLTLAILVIFFLVKVYVVKAIFDIKKMQHQLEVQSKLLALMAEKQGASRSDITNATREEGGSSKNPFDVQR